MRFLVAAAFSFLVIGAHAQNFQVDKQLKNVVVLDNLELSTSKKTNMELSWRAPSQTVNFSLSMAPRAKPTKAQVVVWVLGGTDQQPHSPGKGGTSNSSRGRVAFTKSLGEVSGKTSFSLNFAEFAPQGNPGIITFTVGKTTPLEQSARAMAEQLKKDTLSIIGRSGTACLLYTSPSPRD